VCCMENRILEQTKKLTMVLGIGGLNGSLAIAAIAGLFKFENVLLIGALFLAGPGAIVTAALIGGAVRERIMVALLAGLFSTLIVILAAGFGPMLLSKINIDVMKITGGIAIGIIALMVAGIKIPGNVPFVVIILGIIGGIILR
jgi:hypothetical protein